MEDDVRAKQAIYEHFAATGRRPSVDDVAERVSIVTGASSIREVEITSGLNEGDRIVVSDTDPFKNAARVLLSN